MQFDLGSFDSQRGGQDAAQFGVGLAPFGDLRDGHFEAPGVHADDSLPSGAGMRLNGQQDPPGRLPPVNGCTHPFGPTVRQKAWGG